MNPRPKVFQTSTLPAELSEHYMKDFIFLKPRLRRLVGIEPTSIEPQPIVLPLNYNQKQIKIFYMRGVGFEPTMSYNNSFTDYRLKPLSHPLHFLIWSKWESNPHHTACKAGILPLDDYPV